MILRPSSSRKQATSANARLVNENYESSCIDMNLNKGYLRT